MSSARDAPKGKSSKTDGCVTQASRRLRDSGPMTASTASWFETSTSVASPVKWRRIQSASRVALPVGLTTRNSSSPSFVTVQSDS